MRTINTTRFGEITIEKNKIIHFANGLPAFDEEKEFVLLMADEAKPYIFLQSTVTAELAFLLTSPYIFFPDYEFSLTDDIVQELQIKDEKDIEVYTLVTIPKGVVKNMTANLLAPVVINRKNNEAQQVILEKSSYHTKHPLFHGKGEKKC